MEVILMADKPPLRAVSNEERRREPPTLAEAVESGDVLDMLLAQRRLVAEALTQSADNTRPQLNNELNKLHVLIREEQVRRRTVAEQSSSAEVDVDDGFDANAI
ncbi:hypothetical protein ACPXB3_21580 [Gordonia sp. DT219]|uniref:hypothetical protein n=1 Tax=Gordonia sp. DT219 TaxID=3416658 RepID=UPI003CF6E756